MLDKSIRILNFDNSIISQSELLARYSAKIVDFTSLASRARLFVSCAQRREIANKLEIQDKYSPTFIGSGDFHHLSEILTAQIIEPTVLFVFDFHPDWDILPPRFGCGSWVTQALENKNISKCILLGMGSSDLACPGLQTGNLSALENDRLEIYPYRQTASWVYGRKIPANISVDVKRGKFRSKINWRQLEGKNLDQFILKLIQRLPTKKVYISIDKDCLNQKAALSNWEEGCLSLEQLLLILKILRQNLDIIGLDITGEYSAVKINNKFKALISRLDHPAEVVADKYSLEKIKKLNQETNLAILQEIYS